MFAATLVRRGLALGSALLVTGALGVVGVVHPAAATTAVLYATVDCTGSNHSGDTRDWYPSNVRLPTSPPSTPPAWSRSPPRTRSSSPRHCPPGPRRWGSRPSAAAATTRTATTADRPASPAF